MTPASTARQGGTFLVIGLVATAVHVSVALAVRAVFRLEPLTANLIAYACAVGVSYVGNARLTFGRSTRDPAQAARFLFVSLLGLALNQALIQLLVKWAGWPFWLALLPVVILVPLLSFLLMKFWAFGERRLRASRPAQRDAP